METSAKGDFKALEALRAASENSMSASKVTISYNLYAYLEAVLKERIEANLEDDQE